MTAPGHVTAGEAGGLRAVHLAGLGPERASRVLELVRAVPDYPGPGIVFRDITGLLADGDAFGHVVEALGDVARAAGGSTSSRAWRRAASSSGRRSRRTSAWGSCRCARRASSRRRRTPSPTTSKVRHRDDRAPVGNTAPGARVLVVDDVLATGARRPRAPSSSSAGRRRGGPGVPPRARGSGRPRAARGPRGGHAGPRRVVGLPLRSSRLVAGIVPAAAALRKEARMREHPDVARS